ncbi:MAG TPA: sigma-70 family RNA polymerase sigma factor [Pyrinomonadaceae bacterium]|nr:sigma-70 family RNA polymerase sigma factor [Pyrinomonadaceae bacterium]
MAYDSTGTQAAEAATLTMADRKRTDHEIVDAVRGGDEAAFGEIIERYRGPITNFLYRFLNDYEEAVDLAQESFVRVYFALDRYHKEYAFSTYLYRIASNLAISELRRRKRRKLVSLTGLFSSEDDQDVEFQPPDTRALPEDETIDKEREQVIAKAIASLPDKYRLPIVLRDVQGHSYEEVAAILELGLGTTKSRISRGRGLLKDKLEKYFVSDER